MISLFFFFKSFKVHGSRSRTTKILKLTKRKRQPKKFWDIMMEECNLLKGFSEEININTWQTRTIMRNGKRVIVNE